MTDEQISTVRRVAIPWGTFITAIGMAWALVGQLVSIRDDILDRCHAVDLRITTIEQWRLSHDAELARISAQFDRAVERISQHEREK